MALSKHNFIFKLLVLRAIFFCLTTMLCAENFSAQKTIVIAATENPSEPKKMGFNDCIAVMLPEDLTFVQGIEIQVKIPKATMGYNKSIAYALYNDISPAPTEKNVEYSGKEIYKSIYPEQLSWSITVPLTERNTIKQSPYADKTAIPEHEGGFVFLRNKFEQKVVPKKLLNVEFDVTARLVLSDWGALKVTTVQDPSEYFIVIDENKTVPDSQELFFLKPGKHNLSVISEKYRNEVRTFLIEQAKITEISFNLQSVAATFSLNMPQGTKLFVDGEEITNIDSLKLKKGSHIFKFTLGGYELVKNVDIQNGKNYKISVNFDATITTEE